MRTLLTAVVIALVARWLMRDAIRSWRSARLMRDIERDLARARLERMEAVRWN